MEKHPLETDKKLSIVYALAYPEPTSKKKIQRIITESGRYEEIFDEYKHYFNHTKRKDNRMGILLQSKPKYLVEYINLKIKQSNNQRGLTSEEQNQLLSILKNKTFKQNMFLVKPNDIKQSKERNDFKKSPELIDYLKDMNTQKLIETLSLSALVSRLISKSLPVNERIIYVELSNLLSKNLSKKVITELILLNQICRTIIALFL